MRTACASFRLQAAATPHLNVCINEIKPFQSSVAFHIETSHLFSSAKQMIGFYMKCNTWIKLAFA